MVLHFAGWKDKIHLGLTEFFFINFVFKLIQIICEVKKKKEWTWFVQGIANVARAKIESREMGILNVRESY